MKRKIQKENILGLLAVALLAGPPAANAVTISDSSVYSFSWSYDVGSYALTGNGSMTLSGFGSNLLTVLVTLNNTSPNPGQGGDRLVSFGFGVDPNATGVTFVDSNDGGMRSAGFVSNGTMVSNVPGVEICAWGGNNCSGNGNGGVFAGASDTFTLRLAGNWGSSVNIDPIGLRYQTGAGSFTFRLPPPSSVPEPATLGLLGLGLIGIGFARRRKTN